MWRVIHARTGREILTVSMSLAQYWDMTAKGVDNNSVAQTSWALFGASTLVSLGLTVI